MYVYLQQCIHIYTYRHSYLVQGFFHQQHDLPMFLLLQKRWLSAIAVALLKDIMPFVKGNPCWWNGIIFTQICTFFLPTSKVSHVLTMTGQQYQMGPWDSCLPTTREVVPLSYLIIWGIFKGQASWDRIGPLLDTVMRQDETSNVTSGLCCSLFRCGLNLLVV